MSLLCRYTLILARAHELVCQYLKAELSRDYILHVLLALGQQFALHHEQAAALVPQYRHHWL